jgi:hypothetical protein
MCKMDEAKDHECPLCKRDLGLPEVELFKQYHGLIVGEWEEKETGRKRRYYKITRSGRTALKDKLAAWSAICAGVGRVLEKTRGSD